MPNFIIVTYIFPPTPNLPCFGKEYVENQVNEDVFNHAHALVARVFMVAILIWLFVV